MAVISDLYFPKSYYEKKYDKPSVDTSTINTEVLNNVFVAPAVENIIDDKNQKEESVMNNNEDKTSKEEMIIGIATMIASGIDCATIRKKYTLLSARSVNEILRQKCYKSLTKSIFSYDQNNRVIKSIKDGKEYPYDSYIATNKQHTPSSKVNMTLYQISKNHQRQK